MMRRLLATLVGVFVLTVSGVISAAGAGAAPSGVTLCTPSHPVTAPVAGNLIVTAGTHCRLLYEVAGNARLDHNAFLDTFGGDVAGHLTVGPDAYALFDSAAVGGSVTLDHAAGFEMLHRYVSGSFTGSLSDKGGGVYFDVAGVIGRVAVTGSGNGEQVITLDGADLEGDAVFDGVAFASYDSSSFGGNLTLSNVVNAPVRTSPYGVAYTGTQLCGGTVAGNLSVKDTSGSVYLGTGPVCRADETRLTMRSSLDVTDNTASVFLGGHLVGDAVCRGNLHHPRGNGNNARTELTVDGHRLGQCQNLPRP